MTRPLIATLAIIQNACFVVARATTKGVRARREDQAARTSRKHGTAYVASLLRCAPRLQTGRGGGLPHADNTHPRSSPKREERRGATRRRGAAFTRRQPRAATAEDARPPRRPTHPPRGDVLTTGGTRALRAWEGAGASAPPRSDRGRAYRSNNVPPRLPKRSGRAAPSAAQAAPQGRAQRPRGREPESEQVSSAARRPSGRARRAAETRAINAPPQRRNLDPAARARPV